MIIVSPEDQHLLSLKWVTTSGYARCNRTEDGKRRYVMLHRFIARAAAGQTVDHINGNSLDNRRENLRICSPSENLKNRRVHRNNRLGVKGVFLHRGLYRAQIKCDNKRYHLGDFITVEDAKAAYAVAALRLHGEFARAE